MNSECPACGVLVDDSEVEEADTDDSAKCPECGVMSPLDDWVE